ncbi:MAG: type II secretion system F family protein [Lachnospiraceae bacterium]|nr:type II secretion system F family protein [Lachnospiraceae bacterium]
MTVILAAAAIAVLGVSFLLAGYVILFRQENPDRELLRDAKKGYLGGGYLLCLWKRRFLRKVQLQKREEQFYRAMYVNENPAFRRLCRECRQGLAVFGLLTGFGVVMLLMAARGAFSDVKVETFQRPGNGTEVYHLKAVYQNEEYEMDLSVRERTLTESEIRTAWESAKQTLPDEILGKNPSLDEVSTRLNLPKKLPGTNADLVWMSSDYRIVDHEGKVYPANVPSEGHVVTVTARLKYGTVTEFFDIPIRVVKENGVTDIGEMLQEQLAKSDADQIYETTMELPTDMGESPIEFYKKKSRTPWLFACLLIVLLIGISAKWVSEEKQMRKEREDQLLRDYPDLVSKITLLMQAGLTLRSAWDRITEDYISSRKNDTTRYVYEEMRNTRNRLNAGVPEETAYEEFGRNCGNIRYLRLSSVLVQNLKKGTGGLVPLLRKEAAEAFADRRERVKQSGEEAGTKLLVPMAGILVLILAIIMIPAFMSF